MKSSVAAVLVLALVLRATPAAAAAPDLGEARRRFVAAVHASDQAVAVAEASVDDLIKSAGSALTGDHQRELESLQKLLKALRDFKAAKIRILAGDLATYEKVMKAAYEHSKEVQLLAAVFMVTVAVVVTVVAVVTAVFTFGAAAAGVAVAVAAVAAILSVIAVLLTSLPEILRALGFREAGDSTERWMKDNPWFGATLMAFNIVAAVISTCANAITSLRAAEVAAREAQAKLQALPKPPAPPPALTSFDGYLGSSFAVHLDSGKATVGSAEATLEGGLTISPKSDPSLKLSVSGRVVLRVRPGSSSGPAGSSFDQTTYRATVLGAGPQVATWFSLEGQGSARITGFGPAVTIPSVALQSQANNIVFTSGEASFRGCTHTLAAGSVFTTSQVLFEGSLKCGPWSLTSSSMGIDKTSVAGAGTLTAWSKSFTMTYSASGDGLSARGSLSGADTPWTRVPGFEAEYRIEAPKLDLKLEGPTLSPTLRASKVSVRTVARKKDGSPWSSASLTPDTMVVPVPPADAVPVPFPVLPAPADVEKTARDACEAGARRTLAGKALQAALDACRSGHPPPPAVPTLPRTISLKVGDVLR